jgi:penicillin-binding protein 1A
LGFAKPSGGKTGTTNDFKDAWFAGYSSALTCAVWVGFDTPKKTFEGGFGSVLSLPVWAEIMKAADGFGYKAVDLHNNSGLVEVGLCRLSGKRATSGCKAADTAMSELLPSESVPEENDFCPIHPARAMAVEEVDAANGDAVPLRAKIVDESPLRAEIVEEDESPLRALPVEEP